MIGATRRVSVHDFGPAVVVGGARCALVAITGAPTSASRGAGETLVNRCLAFTSACSLRRTVPSRATGEGDVIVGPQHRSAIGTLVERHARYVKLLHLPRQDSVQLRDGLLRALAGLPTRLLPSITWD